MERLKVFWINNYNKHAVISFSLVIALTLLISLKVAIGLTLLLGLGKEFYHDWYLKKGTFDKMDIYYNLIGIIIAIILILIAKSAF